MHTETNQILHEDEVLQKENNLMMQNEYDLTVFETRVCAKLTLKTIRSRFVINLESTKKRILDTLEEVFLNFDTVRLLTMVRHLDDYTFEHSVNVCIYAMFAADMMGYDNQRLLDLAFGSILHDVGKVKVDEKILKKPGKLTNDEYAQIKLHTTHGFDMICECDSISKRSAYIAYGHHERINASGYPLGMSGYQIPEEARIVAIADVYDALVSDRVYRNKMWPGEVVDYIMAYETGYFDDEIFKVFLKFIAVYPVGTKVLLSNNKRGVVVSDNMILPSKPVVRLLESKQKCLEGSFDESQSEEIMLDLSLQKGVYISLDMGID